MPKVSIVVPVFNVQDFLAECLQSLVDQTLKDIEIIVVDDGSTDSSLAIAQDFAAQDRRIKIISKPNAGYGHSMNRGFEAATGDYIGIVESDDYARPDMFEFLYMQAKQNDAQIVRSNYYNMSEGGAVFDLVDVTGFAKAPYYQVIDPADHPEILRGSPAIWTALYERTFIEDNHLTFVESPGASYQDTGFFLKAFMTATRIVLVREAFLNYRVDNANSSVKSSAKIFCVSDEYHSVEDFLNSTDELKARRERFKHILQAKKYETYLWNYNRLTDDSRVEFLQLMTNEFAEADARGELWNNLFTDAEWADLRMVIDAPDQLAGRELAVDEHGTSADEYYQTCRANGTLPAWKYSGWKALQLAERLRRAAEYRLGKYTGIGLRSEEDERALLDAQAANALISETSNQLWNSQAVAAPVNASAVTIDDSTAPAAMEVAAEAGASNADVPADPLVSIIVPVYNASPYLQELMNSLRAQTYQNLEMIFVDDGSTDESILVLERFMQEDVRVKVYPRDNGGAGAARNFGMEQAAGEYFCFVDADDFVEPSFIEEVTQAAVASNADVVIFNMDEYNEQTGKYSNTVPAVIVEHVPSGVAFRASEIPHFYKNVVGYTVNKLYRTAFMKQLGIKFTSLAAHEDLPFTYLALSAAERVLFINKVYYHYRVAQGQSRSGSTNEHYAYMFQALRQLQHDLKAHGLWDEYERIYLNYVLHMCTWKWWSLPYVRRLEFRDACRRHWLADFDLLAHDATYFYDPSEYAFIEDTLNMGNARRAIAGAVKDVYRIQE